MALKSCLDIGEIEVAQAIDLAMESLEGSITLKDLVKKAVPELSDDSIEKYITYNVNGVKVTDWNMTVNENDIVKVLPRFAGG